MLKKRSKGHVSSREAVKNQVDQNLQGAKRMDVETDFTINQTASKGGRYEQANRITAILPGNPIPRKDMDIFKPIPFINYKTHQIRRAHAQINYTILDRSFNY
jgi:hypothetical protein